MVWTYEDHLEISVMLNAELTLGSEKHKDIVSKKLSYPNVSIHFWFSKT
jgi:hypothetical protein